MIPFCPDVSQIAFVVFGQEIGQSQVIVSGLILAGGTCFIYRRLARIFGLKYKDGSE